MSLKSFLFILICLTLMISISQAFIYDQLVLALQWPAAKCRESRCTPAHPTGDFFIHGLWPSRNNGQDPIKCVQGKPYDSNVCSSPYLANDLNSVWPNLLGPNDMFWRREWETHGTCAYELFPDQAGYFHKTIILKYNNNVQSWLSLHQIRPYRYRDYYVRSIKTAIANEFGAIPRLRCTTAYGIPRQLVEVRLCFDEAGTMPQDCLRPDINCGSRKIKWYA